MKISIIPKVPDSFRVTEKIQKEVNRWVSYFKELSVRIKVCIPTDKEFEFEKWQNMAKIQVHEEEDIEGVEILDWPNIRQVAFIVCFDSALPGHAKEYLLSNFFIFCYGNIAFSLCYFDVEDYTKKEYSLHNFDRSALAWTHIAKAIRSDLEEIQKVVPHLPRRTRQ